MKKRELGNSGLEVCPLAFGGNVFGWTVDEATAFRLLDAFVAAGCNLIDTADSYSHWVAGNHGGESETIIGKWLKRTGNRAKVAIATKVGSAMGQDRKGLSKAHILRAAEDSLRRLQTDHIDLYQSHIDDAETPFEETLSAYAELIRQGKVRAIGASNYSTGRLAAALDVSERQGLPRYESLQPLYNLNDRAEYETQLAPLCVEKNIGVISYFSLASGFLTGKYRSEDDLSKSARGERVRKFLNPRGLRILDALDRVAREQNAAPATVALAWLMARPGITAPIASATSLGQLDQLLAATRMELSGSAMRALDKASAFAASA